MHPNAGAINDHVDGALGQAESAEVERHLDACAECRRLANDLRELRRHAAALPPMEPPARVWGRLERALEREPAPRAWTRWPMRPAAWWSALAAAALLLLGTLVVLQRGWVEPQPLPASGPVAQRSASDPPTERELAQSVEAELRQAEQHYDKAIKGLEQITKAEEGALDPQTVATLQKSLTVIDQAISESRAAVNAQPTSEPAQQSLLESFKAKLALLQDTVALINEMRKGNEAGAAQIVSDLKQQGD